MLKILKLTTKQNKKAKIIKKKKISINIKITVSCFSQLNKRFQSVSVCLSIYQTDSQSNIQYNLAESEYFA